MKNFGYRAFVFTMLVGAGSLTAQAAEKPALVARLENARVEAGPTGSISVDFVLVNQSEEPVKIAERWNSWGAFQWTLQLTDAQGKVIGFENDPNQCWTVNYLTVATIAPGKEHRSKCLLTLKGPSPLPKGVEVFQPVKDAKAAFEKADLGAAARLTGTFAAKDLHQMEAGNGYYRADAKPPVIATNWTGSITSQPVAIAAAVGAEKVR